MTDKECVDRIMVIINRNMTPSGPNQDAEALIWALSTIKQLSKQWIDHSNNKLVEVGKGDILSTSWSEEGF